MSWSSVYNEMHQTEVNTDNARNNRMFARLHLRGKILARVLMRQDVNNHFK